MSSHLNFVTLDTETTGFSARDEILSCGIIDCDGNTLVDTLVKTQYKKSWFHAQQIHHISPADIALNGIPHSKFLEQTAEKIAPFEQVIIYNAKFDTRFFPAGFFKNHEVICAMQVSARFLQQHQQFKGTGKSIKQSNLADILKINIGDLSLHSARDDAELCRRIWLKMLSESRRHNINLN